MAVKTPELEEPVYTGQQQAAGATAPMPTGQEPQSLPQGAGFVPKSGAAAYVANGIIDGWLKGRQIAATRNMQTAQNEIGSMKNIYDDQAQRYKAAAMQSGPDSKEAQSAKNDAVVAWNQYNQIRMKYMIPDAGDKGGKKGKGGKEGGGGFGGAMGKMAGNLFGKSGVTPHMIPEMAIKATQNNPVGLNLNPQDLVEMERYKQEKAQTEESQARVPLTKIQVEEAQRVAEVNKRKDTDDVQMQTIVKIPEDKRTPAQQQWLDGWQKVQHINDPASQQTADQVLGYIRAGKEIPKALMPFAVAQRLVEGPHAIQFNDGLTTYTAMQQPDGTITNKTKLGKVYHEDEAAAAARTQGLLYNQKVAHYIHGGMSPKEAEQAAMLEDARNPALVAQFIGNNPIATEMRHKAVSDALKTVFNNAGGLNADSETRKAAQAVLSNFVDGDPKGAKSYLTFRNQIADPTKKGGWFSSDKYAGGITQDKLKAAQGALYNEVRTTIQQQHPEMTPMELDLALPDWLKSPEGQPPAGVPGATGDKQITRPPLGGATVGERAEKIGNVLTAPARAAIGVGEYLLGKPGDGKDAPVKGEDGFYGKKGKGTKEYRVRTAEGWVKYHMTDDEVKKAKENSFDVQPLEMTTN